ncbi:MAG TPA: biotin--[acetyl-CoA-carboxylase] ligase [Rhizomicrobium sp.]|nr:biotin--[acetyl-CoA-carboxylase] ligase [Rhizomicrobium sp.]
MKEPPVWPAGHALRHLEEIDSTNEEARRLAVAGVEGPLWILADRQIRGRGRRGREWHSLAGNLSATLLLHPASRVSESAQLSFVAALAACDLVAHHAPAAAVKLKWPNDVLADGRKIAGILLEASGNDAAAPDWLAIGFGVNLVWHPTDAEFPATSLLAQRAHPPAAPDALARLAAGWAGWYDLWESLGFAPIRNAWLARAAGIGERIRARLPGEEATGVFEGIDESGALLLRESTNRLRTIAAADVFF